MIPEQAADSPLLAPQMVSDFEMRHGRASLDLAAHAAVAHRLRPEILALIRSNFLTGPARAQPSHDADVLFGPLCEAQGGGFFEMHAEVKVFLVGLLDRLHRGNGEAEFRSQQVARMLRHYFEKVATEPRYASQRFHRFRQENLWRLIALDDPDAARQHIFEHARKRNTFARDMLGDAPRGSGIIAVAGDVLGFLQEDLAYLRAQDLIADGESDEGQYILELLDDAEFSHAGIELTAPDMLLAEERSFQRRRNNMQPGSRADFAADPQHAATDASHSFTNDLRVDAERMDLRDTPLLAAAREGDHAKVRDMLAAGAPDIDQLDRYGLSALHHAIRSGHGEMALALIDAGANVNVESAFLATPLLFCADHGLVEVARRLLQEGADPLHRTAKKTTPLMVAGHYGHRDLFDLLMSTGKIDAAHLNTPNDEGYLVLQGPAALGDLDLFERLLELGAVIAPAQPASYTLLHSAADGGSAAIVSRIIEAGFAVDPLTVDGWSPLHVACANPGSVEVARLLIDCGADPWRPSIHGWAPADLAANWNHPDILDTLGKAGVELTGRMLEEAAMGGAAASMAYLIDRVGLRPPPDCIDKVVRSGKADGVAFLFERPELFKANHTSVFIEAVRQARPTIIRHYREKVWPDALPEDADKGWPAAIDAHTDQWAQTMAALLEWPQIRAGGAARIFEKAVKFGDAATIRLFGERGWPLPAVPDGRTSWVFDVPNAAKTRDEAIVALLQWKQMQIHDARTGRSLLVDAVEGKLARTFEALLDRGVDVNEADGNGMTPLGAATRAGNRDLTERLLKAGAEPNRPSGRQDRPVIFEADAACMEILLRHGADIHGRGPDGSTILHNVARSGKSPDRDHVERLISGHGLQLDARDLMGQTPLHVAAQNGLPERAKQLLEAGADIDARTNFGLTPLFDALAGGHTKMVDLLLQNGAEPGARTAGGWSLLHVAAERNLATEVTRFWPLLGGADVAASTPPRTALQVAAESGSMDAVSELLRLGADVDGAAGSSPSPLHLALATDSLEVAQALLKAGADRDLPDQESGFTVRQRIEAAVGRHARFGEEPPASLQSLAAAFAVRRAATPRQAPAMPSPPASAPVPPPDAAAPPASVLRKPAAPPIFSSDVFLASLDPVDFWVNSHGWEPLTGGMPGRMMAALRRLDANKYSQSPITQYAARRLPFYDEAQLVRLSSRGWNDNPRALFFLVSNGNISWLRGAAAPIHEMNAAAPARITAETALDYLRFFCFFTHAEHGPFYVLESPDDPIVRPLLPGYAALLAKTARPARVEAAENPGRIECSATISYGNALFRANFIIHPDGRCEMTDDEPLATNLPATLDLALS